MARWHSGGGIRGAGGLRARPAEDAPALHRTGARPVPSPCRWLMGACVHFARFRTKIKTLSNGSTSVWQTQWVRAPTSARTLHFPLPKTLCPPQGAEGRLGDEASAVTSCPHSLGRALLLANSLRRNTSVPSCSRKTRTCFLEMRPLTQNFITRRWRGAGLPPRALGAPRDCAAPARGLVAKPRTERRPNAVFRRSPTAPRLPCPCRGFCDSPHGVSLRAPGPLGHSPQPAPRCTPSPGGVCRDSTCTVRARGLGVTPRRSTHVVAGSRACSGRSGMIKGIRAGDPPPPAPTPPP